jgi:aspartyl-tRNA(Asn)/glutamyl-tRNA(Gln) amidotransferase subunit C
MQIDEKLIKHVASVARLNLTETEIKEFIPQLKEILAAFSEIEKVDTKDTEPSFHPVELKNALREDIVKESISQEDALKNTVHKKDGYFKGPKVI